MALLLGLLLGCGSTQGGPKPQGSGGSSATGGMFASGGSGGIAGMGGSMATGHTTSTSSSGGNSATGGNTTIMSTGGDAATGGRTGAGGVGGTTASGGSAAEGGSTTTSSTGGRTGAGGSGGTAPMPTGGRTNQGGAAGTGGAPFGGGGGGGGNTGSGGNTSTGGTGPRDGAPPDGNGPADVKQDVASGGTGGPGGLGGTGGSGGAGGAGGGGYSPCPTNGDPCKIMPFGDSITEGAPNNNGGYRIQLFHLAHQAGKNITFVGSNANGPAQVDGVPFPRNNEGHGGYTIDNATGHSGIAPLVSTVMPAYTPHIVLLMIGTNDATYQIDMANAPKRLGSLIDSIYAQLPNVLLIVAQPIPTKDSTINGLLQTYNAAIPAVVQTRSDAGKHIRLVNMWPVITDAGTQLQDTWHPTSDGYILLGAAWYNALSDVLN